MSLELRDRVSRYSGVDVVHGLIRHLCGTGQLDHP